ncbi:GGDEF domain-containing protein [Celeribacter sp.]|uniref:GGDEF domain-containing protein n=2 Tax=Celeribacter sp. TaxID=1890673 RepID=UPI003A8D443D
MRGQRRIKTGFSVPTDLGAPRIAKFMATVSLLILPIAIVKYAMSGHSWLAGYYLFLCGLILFDLRAYLSGKRLPINAAILLIAVQIGDLILIRHHGTSAAFWLFPITVAGFFYCALWVATSIGVVAMVLGPVLSYLASHDPWFAFRLGVALGTVILFVRFMLTTMWAMQANLEHALERDALTGCYNRRAFMRLIRGDVPVSSGALLFVDIDHFKKINDRHGHIVGDKVLVAVVEAMREVLKGQGHIYRIGGEEFALLMPNTPIELAAMIAERMRRHISQQAMPGEAGEADREAQGTVKTRVTVSIGVEKFSSGEEIEAALSRADNHLYRAKQAGRDRVMSSMSVSDDGPARGEPSRFSRERPEDHSADRESVLR